MKFNRFVDYSIISTPEQCYNASQIETHYSTAFAGSKPVPNCPSLIRKGLLVLTVHRRQIPQAFPGLREEQLTFQRRPGLSALHQFVYLKDAGVMIRLTFPDIAVKVVGMKGTEQAAGSQRFQVPYIPVVMVAVGPRPAHLDQRVFIPE